jgi:hypothetical protein
MEEEDNKIITHKEQKYSRAISFTPWNLES